MKFKLSIVALVILVACKSDVLLTAEGSGTESNSFPVDFNAYPPKDLSETATDS